MSILKRPDGDLTLLRHPIRARDTLRAWDAADEYLLSHLAETDVNLDRLLIVNDGYGALALSLAYAQPTVVSDSFVGRQSTVKNAALNDIDLAGVTFRTSTAPWMESPTTILLKLPKSHQQLVFQLSCLQRVMTASTVLIAAEMTKYLRRTALDSFTGIIGPTRTSLARKKARLIFATLDRGLVLSEAPTVQSYTVPGMGIRIADHPHVFSAGRLDRGSRLLLKHLPEVSGHVADLGCGSGVLGLGVARRNPSVHLSFFDESYIAVENAKTNWLVNDFEPERARFHVSDCMSGYENEPFDLILCNPPFHEGRAVTDTVAHRMFKQARSHLVPNGRLMVVGNRHLGHHVRLKRLFGHCDVVGTDGKFVILSVKK